MKVFLHKNTKTTILTVTVLQNINWSKHVVYQRTQVISSYL